MNLPIKPGRLIHYRCYSGGRILNEWEAIYHGGNVVHTVGGRRTGGTWLMSESQPEDKITVIRHGVLVERDWDAVARRVFVASRAFDSCI